MKWFDWIADRAPTFLNTKVVLGTLVVLIALAEMGTISFGTFWGIIVGLCGLVCIIASVYVVPVAKEMISELPPED